MAFFHAPALCATASMVPWFMPSSRKSSDANLSFFIFFSERAISCMTKLPKPRTCKSDLTICTPKQWHAKVITTSSVPKTATARALASSSRHRNKAVAMSSAAKRCLVARASTGSNDTKIRWRCWGKPCSKVAKATWWPCLWWQTAVTSADSTSSTKACVSLFCAANNSNWQITELPYWSKANSRPRPKSSSATKATSAALRSCSKRSST
mmetsp:Transcript_130701/g.419154  ORF Transcript_130701/g.419154 Transcript_130701/m.419154 type:complete len:210 (-) Transcript_130701:459-1088(-)